MIIAAAAAARHGLSCAHLARVGTATGRRFASSTRSSLTLRVDRTSGMEKLGGTLADVLMSWTRRDGCRSNTSVCLFGDIGTGKTVFSRGFLRRAMNDDRLEVGSPTFLLANEYVVADGIKVRDDAFVSQHALCDIDIIVHERVTDCSLGSISIAYE